VNSGKPMKDAECLMQAVREFRAGEAAMGRKIVDLSELDTGDRERVMSRYEELKRLRFSGLTEATVVS